MGALSLKAGNWWGWIFTSAAVLLIWGYLRYGTIHVAFQAHLRGEDAAVERYLAQTRFPGFLRPSDRSYFDFLSGIVAVQKGEHTRAREHFDRAVLGPLRTDNMRSVIFCHLAAIAIAEDDPKLAAAHLEKAKSTPHRSETDEMIAKLEKSLAEG